MLRDLKRRDWLRILELSDSHVPAALVLRGTRNLKRQAEIHRGYLSNPVELGSPNGLIEDVWLGTLAGRNVAYASVYGAPMAAEITHLFGVLGTRFVVQTGCCGAWIDGLQAGDLFVPTRAFCGDGASAYYVSNKQIVKPTARFSERLPIDCSGGLRIFRGGIYTTAALFAEGLAEIEHWARDGWDAADMETATTFAVAEHFGMESVAILFAFDNPRHHGDIMLNDNEKDARRQRGNQCVMESAFGFVREYLSGKLDSD